MICYGFKGGSGTASRVVAIGGEAYALGVFVQANFGLREQLTIAGVAVGQALKAWPNLWTNEETGSVIAIVATDAPLLPHQLTRLARRVSLGIGRSGAISGHGSGDIFMAFSTANAEALSATGGGVANARFLPDAALGPLFAATIQATDEAVLNALVVNETMTGIDGRTVEALPHAELRRLLALA